MKCLNALKKPKCRSTFRRATSVQRWSNSSVLPSHSRASTNSQVHWSNHQNHKAPQHQESQRIPWHYKLYQEKHYKPCRNLATNHWTDQERCPLHLEGEKSGSLWQKRPPSPMPSCAPILTHTNVSSFTMMPPTNTQWEQCQYKWWTAPSTSSAYYHTISMTHSWNKLLESKNS